MTRQEFITEARRLYVDASYVSIRVEHTARVKTHPNGAWVQGWLWVDKETTPSIPTVFR